MKIMKFGVIGLGLALAACSAKVSSPQDIPNIPTKPAAFEHKVQGPNLDGEWQSLCVADKWSSNYVSFNLKIKNQDTSRVITSFSDEKCTQQLKVDTQLGLFRYVKKYSTEIYEVEYQIAFNGGHFYIGENIELKNDNTLMISDRYTGESVQPDIQLSRVGAPSAPTSPTAPSTPPTSAPTPPTSTSSESTDSVDHSPVIGQEVAYSVRANGTSGTELYDVQGYDSSTQQWSVFYDIEHGGQPEMGYDHLPSLWSTVNFRDLMKSCVPDGGTIETITVPAGTFKTCKLKTSDHYVWKGNVPVYGVVKYETFDKSYLIELKSYIAKPK